MADAPGRTCPLSYRTNARGLLTAPLVQAETLYVVGGLYGNHLSLASILALADAEVRAGLAVPTLVFNGDFNWFNAELRHFRSINETVLEHVAMQGNVELEIAQPSPGAGCGCAYPDWVDGGVVERSNRIMERLQGVAASAPDIRERLRRLPCQLRARVGDLRLGILHGDPDSVAGWGLALEAMPPAGECNDTIGTWFTDAEVDAFACTHTCVAYMQDFRIHDRHCLVVNNGSAGMANFRGDRRGLITRVSVSPPLVQPMYGTTLCGVHCDAVPVDWDMTAWDGWFGTRWPSGSPAARSYGKRIKEGPGHQSDRAMRVEG